MGWGGGCEEATWLYEATAGVEQLSLFGWQIRVESDPVMAANWLKQRCIGQRNILDEAPQLLQTGFSGYNLVSIRQMLMRGKFVKFGPFQTSFDAVFST